MLKNALFVSDIHLSTNDPATAALFFHFLRTAAGQAGSLYILGDLFDTWVGDDDLDDPFNAQVASELRACGIPVFLLHGNRDFLLGEDFFRASGVNFLHDPSLIELPGNPTLVSHGDLFCTLDPDYLAFRSQVRDPLWQSEFLSKSLADRRAFADKLRLESETGKRHKSSYLMDVDAAEVEKCLRSHGYPRIIHGHTHLPGMHWHEVDGRRCERWVLGDWHPEGASILYCDADNAEIRVVSNR